MLDFNITHLDLLNICLEDHKEFQSFIDFESNRFNLFLIKKLKIAIKKQTKSYPVPGYADYY